MAKTVKNPPAMQETWVCSLGQEDPLEKGIATHSSILAWRIPWTEEPGGLQSMGWQRVRHELTSDTFFFFAGFMVTLKILERKCSLSLFKYENEIVKFDLARYNINIGLFTSLSPVSRTVPSM